MYFNIGDRLEREFSNWNQGACMEFETNYERRKIETDLIAEYGSATVF